MREVHVGENEAGQRLDKLLGKLLKEAPKSFCYKMLRKKNITLNDKKADGSERLSQGDVVKLYLAEETYLKMTGEESIPEKQSQKESNFGTQVKDRAKERKGAEDLLQQLPIDVLYEDDHIMLLNKPAGVLSQKAHPEDVSAVEWLIAHELACGRATEDSLRTFRPGVCNRLDRNTSGILIAGVSLAGLQTMSAMLKDRTMHKYYLCLVKGRVAKKRRLSGYLTKDQSANQVKITKQPVNEQSQQIETEYEPLAGNDKVTLLKVLLITGRSHQIRAHLASEGHPLIGDPRYGSDKVNRYYQKQYGLHAQLLHSYRLELPVLEGKLSYLSGQVFEAQLPLAFQKVLKGEGIWQHGKPEG